MQWARYILETGALQKLASTPDMADALTELAKLGARCAEGISPRESGRHAASFGASVQPGFGGMEGFLGNIAPYCEVVEWVNTDRILGRTLNYLEL